MQLYMNRAQSRRVNAALRYLDRGTKVPLGLLGQLGPDLVGFVERQAFLRGKKLGQFGKVLAA